MIVGKLHKIKRAFDKLPDARKRNLSKYSGVWYRDGDIRFGIYTGSYRRYVRKLCREYLGEVARCDSVLLPGDSQAEAGKPAINR